VSEVLNDGRPVVIESDRDRIGVGAWARSFASSVVPDEGSSAAERGRRLARAGAVHSVTVAEGELSGDAEEHTATIAAEPVPVRIWTAVVRSAVRNASIAAAIEGRTQSVQLQHTMTVDWEEPLVPVGRSLSRSCTCGRDACEHVAALAYAIASEIDRDPELLLRWRGCVDRVEEAPLPVAEPAPSSDVWEAGALPQPRPLRPLPLAAVLKRLGPSGIRSGANDLTDALEPAYAAFAKGDANRY
jgi:hypothetical protein